MDDAQWSDESGVADFEPIASKPTLLNPSPYTNSGYRKHERQMHNC